jgi:hypothetical protein
MVSESSESWISCDVIQATKRSCAASPSSLLPSSLPIVLLSAAAAAATPCAAAAAAALAMLLPAPLTVRRCRAAAIAAAAEARGLLLLLALRLDDSFLLPLLLPGPKLLGATRPAVLSMLPTLPVPP